MKPRLVILLPLLLACGPYFFQAPPLLDAYPPRITGKHWRVVMDESRPAPADAWQADVMAAECRAMVAALPETPADERIARIDGLIERNREGDFRLRVANLLHELREIAADDELLEAAMPYLGWRLARLEVPAGFIGRKPWRDWHWSDWEYQDALDAHEAEKQAVHDVLAAIGAAAPAALQPHIAVQQAALWFESGELAEAGGAFEAVAERFPDHPRAEVARLMAARCALEQARAMIRQRAPGGDAFADEAEVLGLRERAAEGLEDYLWRHPEGRFTADAHGWLAALAFDHGFPGKAVGHQLDRLAIQPTRETLRSVLRECDALFAELMKDLANDPLDLAWVLDFGKIAAHPEVVRLLVYQALDPTVRDEVRPHFGDDEDGGRRSLDFLHRRIIRAEPVARAALANLGRELVRRRDVEEVDPLSLLVLGWSAARDGELTEALALFDRGLASVRSDELIHARAHALSRLGRYHEASLAWAELATGFRDSPLALNARFEQALAEFRAGRPGEALVLLVTLVQPREDPEKKEGGVHNQQFEADNGVPDDDLPLWDLGASAEIMQWIDTISQFASIDDFKQSLQTLPRGVVEAQIRAVVRCRAIAAGDFAMAAERDEVLGPLERALAEARERPTAEAHLAAAELWRSLRGEVTLPSLQRLTYAGSETERQDQLRRRNAAILGFGADEVAAELDSRDELHHALQHYLAAAGLPADPALTAKALEGANEALFRLAEFSLYRLARAVETDAGGLSRQLVDRLRREFPDRPETARAVDWRFTPPRLLGDWMPGDYSPWNSANAIEEAIELAAAAPGDRLDQDGDAAKRNALADIRLRLAALQGEFVGEMPELRAEVARLRADFAALRPMLTRREILERVDDLDDLASVVALPGLTSGLFQRYAAIRLGGGPVPAAVGEWEPLAPWLDFITVRRETDEAEAGARNNRWLAYLERHPDSPKAEAVRLRVLRSAVREVLPIPQVAAFHFPAAPIWYGYKQLVGPAPLTDRFLDRLALRISEYSGRFPGGRYAADIRLLEAAVQAARRDYPEALHRLVAAIDDPAHRELRLDASLQFAEIGLRLLDPDQRPAVAAAFRADPAALGHLRSLIYGDTCLFRLRPLMHWLENPDA